MKTGRRKAEQKLTRKSMKSKSLNRGNLEGKIRVSPFQEKFGEENEREVQEVGTEQRRKDK